jgi:hypothetical protein
MEDNLKDFTVNWAIFGLLFACLMAFTIGFMAANNPIGLNDGSSDIISGTYTSMNGSLYQVELDANEILNITSKTNPEASYLGSRDTVGTSFGTYGTGKSFWTSSKPMIQWIFTGEVGKILIITLGGLIAFLGIYFIGKWIRTGT